MRRVVSFSFFALALAPLVSHSISCSHLFTFRETPWFKKIDFRETESAIKSGKVVRIRDMHDVLAERDQEDNFTTEVYLIELNNGIKAVFKPEYELWNSYGEVAGYRYARWLGIDFVPPTVIRAVNIDGELRYGSAQLYVANATNGGTLNLSWTKILKKFSARDRRAIVAFLFSVGQWDYGHTNILLQGGRNPVLPDNGALSSLLKHRLGEHEYRKAGRKKGARLKQVQFNEAFPYDSPRLLINPSLEEMRKVFGDYMSKAKIENLYKKKDHFTDQTFRYVVWNNTLWIQESKKWKTPLKVDSIDSDILEKLRVTDAEILMREVFYDLPIFTSLHIEAILERIRQLIMLSE